MKILVFGAGGLLGTGLCARLHAAGHEVTEFRRGPGILCETQKEMSSTFAAAFEKSSPGCVINLIAATNVDQCQADMGLAAFLNCFVPQLLSRLCQGGPHLVHISSDQVYGGEGPHDESSASPINAYALTKLIGEYPVLQSGGCVLRTNFFGRSQTASRTSLSDWLVTSGRKGQPVRVFDDVFFSPLRMTTLCDCVLQAAQMRLSGLFNVGSTDGVSKAEFAKLLFEQLGLDQRLLTPASITSVQLDAPRPRDMRMNSGHFTRVAGLALPSIRTEINNEAAEYARS